MAEVSYPSEKFRSHTPFPDLSQFMDPEPAVGNVVRYH